MDFKFSEPNSLQEKKEEKLTVVFSGSYEDSEENSEITVEEGIVEIAENAFRGFKHLRKIRLPKSLRVISAAAFS